MCSNKYLIPTLLILGSFGCVMAYNIIGSSVADDETLIESFGLIPIGFALFILGVISGLTISIWSLFHSPKKSDKWVFGIFTAIIVLFSIYLTASMSYLSEQAYEEIMNSSAL